MFTLLHKHKMFYNEYFQEWSLPEKTDYFQKYAVPLWACFITCKQAYVMTLRQCCHPVSTQWVIDFENTTATGLQGWQCPQGRVGVRTRE